MILTFLGEQVRSRDCTRDFDFDFDFDFGFDFDFDLTFFLCLSADNDFSEQF